MRHLAALVHACSTRARRASGSVIRAALLAGLLSALAPPRTAHAYNLVWFGPADVAVPGQLTQYASSDVPQGATSLQIVLGPGSSPNPSSSYESDTWCTTTTGSSSLRDHGFHGWQVIETLTVDMTGCVSVSILHSGYPGGNTGTKNVKLVFNLPSAPADPAVEAAPAGTEANPPNPNGDRAGDPVQTFTGNFTYTHTDVAIPGRGPSPVFARSYNSDDTRVGPLGPGWTHSYAMRVRSAGDGTGALILVGPQGRSDRYTSNGDGTYTAPAGFYTTLARNVDFGFTATHKDQSAWKFAQDGRLLNVKDRYGNQSALTYDANNRLSAIGDPAGRGSLSLHYNASGLLDTVTDWQTPTARVVTYDYDTNSPPRLRTVTDRLGNQTTFGYDGTSQRVATITDADGHVALTNTYDAQGRVATQKDARGLASGQQWEFAYTVNPDNTRLTTATAPANASGWRLVQEHTYDSLGRITSRLSKPSADTSEWTTESYTYDASSNRSSITDPLTNRTDFCYDVGYDGATIATSHGNLTRVIQPAVGASRPTALFKYDARDNLVEFYPPSGAGNDSGVTCGTNLSAGLLSAYLTSLAYDANGVQLQSITRKFTDPDLGLQTATTKLFYDDSANPGLVTKVVPPRGNTTSTPDDTYATTFTYFPSGDPAAGLLKSVTDPAQSKTTYTYDRVGRLLSMVDPNGNAAGGVQADHTWQYVYDNEDRPTSLKTPPVDGNQLVTLFAYDAVGNRVSATDANGQITRYLYDNRDLLQEVQESPTVADPATDPNKIRTIYGYDDAGNLTRVTRASGNATSERAVDYTYDGLGRVRTETEYPDWPATTNPLARTYTYDRDSNLKSLLDPNGKTTSYSYDALNRPTCLDYADATTPTISFAYDRNGNRTGMGEGPCNSTPTTTYAYDELDRLKSVTTPATPTNKTLAYRYDLDGNRRKLVYSDGTSFVTYTFDKAGRLSSTSDWATPTARTASYEYFADGSLKKVTNPNTTTAQYTYDNAQRLKSAVNQNGATTLSSHTYTLDKVGNRTQVDEVLRQITISPPSGTPQTPPNTRNTGPPPGPPAPGPVPARDTGPSVPGVPAPFPTRPDTITVTTTTTYAYDNLYRLTKINGQTIYAYDPVGNRLSKGATSYVYDKADRLRTVNGVNYSSDNNGNLTVRGTNGSFAYDQGNRPKTANVGGVASTYVYDGDGKRTSKAVGGTTTTYLYDVNQSLPVLLEDGTRKYVWGLGLAYDVDGSNNVEVFHTDGLGSVRAITDAGGVLVQTYATDEFGMPTLSEGSRRAIRSAMSTPAGRTRCSPPVPEAHCSVRLPTWASIGSLGRRSPAARSCAAPGPAVCSAWPDSERARSSGSCSPRGRLRSSQPGRWPKEGLRRPLACQETSGTGGL